MKKKILPAALVVWLCLFLGAALPKMCYTRG